MVFAILLKPKSPKCILFSFRNASRLFAEGAQPRNLITARHLTNILFYFSGEFLPLGRPKKSSLTHTKGFVILFFSPLKSPYFWQ
jgi:hypothetical protein